MLNGPLFYGILGMIIGFFLKGFPFFPIRILGTLIYTNGFFMVIAGIVLKLSHIIFG